MNGSTRVGLVIFWAQILVFGTLTAGPEALPWSFTPPAPRALPDVRDTAWPRTPIDYFILARLEERGLEPAPSADRRTLLRRVTLDLTGLPPTAEEIESFIADPSPDAFVRRVDRLLASPRYGERWGRHWLDVARYADSNGLDENIAHGNAWRYRDYVVESFNTDKPFDRFLTEQLAGDLLAERNPVQREALLIATGFLSLGPKVLAEGDEDKMEMDIVDEQLDTVGKAFLGISFGCARCHDHKFDPIPTQDYYALAGIFKSTRTMEHFKRIARWYEHSIASPEEAKRAAMHAKRIADLSTKLEALAADPERKKELEAEIQALKASAPELPTAMGVTEGTAADLRVHIRGEHWNLGPEAPRAFPQALTTGERRLAAPEQSGRLELAHWLTRAEHPLTSRVIVNRLWRWHFGTGLVGTPDNFGARGEHPTHPALLDWLALRLVESGWSLKAVQRTILLSSVYRQESSFQPDAARVDPDGRLYWRYRPRRLEAETLRDCVLFVSGRLDLTMGGSLVSHVKNREFLFDHTSRDGTRYASNRRSIYLPVIRNHVFDLFHLFDFPDPAVTNGNRATTTVPSQALFVMNSEFMLEAAGHLATQLPADPPGMTQSATDRIERLYLRVLGRRPNQPEVERAVEFLEAARAELGEARDGAEIHVDGNWQALCQVILSTSEFFYVR